MGKVLIACEESQRVCIEFRNRGHEAYSCDLIDCSGEHPEWHIKSDCLPLLNGNCSFMTCDQTIHHIDGRWDLIIAHPPCFIAGTMVQTYEGVKPIEDVVEGDLVLTHKGRYQKVIGTMSKQVTELSEIYLENCGNITCTPNHPFYTKIGNSVIKQSKRLKEFSDWKWLSPTEFISEKAGPKDYKRRTYTTTITDTIEELPEYSGTLVGVNAHSSKIVKTIKIDDPNFWYIVGRWLGDGHFEKKDQNYLGICISCGKHKTEKLIQRLNDSGLHYTGYEKRTAWCYHIYGKEYTNFFKSFGEYATNKKIPGYVTRLPKKLAIALLEGYFDSDGYISKTGAYSFSTVSKSLAYGLKYLINKYYSVPVSINCAKQHTNIIEGRTVNVHTIYQATFRKDKRKGSHYYMEDNYILAPVVTCETSTHQITTVYNLEVEEDNSYTANGIVVHNCTDLAVSGARHFEKKRADGRQRKGIEFFCAFFDADCDHVVIENLIGIISGDYIREYYPDIAYKYLLPKKPTQIIHPWMFGDNTVKSTCLWIKGLPALIPEVTAKPEIEYKEWVDAYGNTKRQAKWYIDALKLKGDERSKARSKTFPGIARAFAEQWSKCL